MKKAIFFDLDGTLWDALDNITDSYNLTFKKHHYNYSFNRPYVQSFMGLTPIETVNLAFSDLKIEEGLNLFHTLFIEELDYLKSKPGKLYEYEINILDKLSKTYDLFIVSNADKGYVETYLDSYNLRKYFKDFIQAGDTKLEKYQNINYLKNKFNYKDEDIVYVGDTFKDKLEANKANVDFIFASYGFGKINEYDGRKLNSLKDLIDVMNSF